MERKRLMSVLVSQIYQNNCCYVQGMQHGKRIHAKYSSFVTKTALDFILSTTTKAKYNHMSFLCIINRHILNLEIYCACIVINLMMKV